MAGSIVKFLNIMFAALIAGTVFGIWAGYNPDVLSPTAYLEQQQNAITGLNTLMPILGFLAIVLTAISTFMQRKNKSVVVVLSVAIVLFIASGLITKFGNQRINTIVMTWDATTMPGNWVELRDNWWSFHVMRTCTTIAGLALVVWSVVGGHRGEGHG
jgi:exosortase/archaeosortase